MANEWWAASVADATTAMAASRSGHDSRLYMRSIIRQVGSDPEMGTAPWGIDGSGVSSPRKPIAEIAGGQRAAEAAAAHGWRPWPPAWIERWLRSQALWRHCAACDRSH